MHGALSESQHVFIKSGLDHYFARYHPDQIRVFEMGFGTGLNAVLAIQYCLEKKIGLHYLASELNMLDIDLAKNLFIPELLELSEQETKVFHNLHEVEKTNKVINHVPIEAQVCIGDFLESSWEESFADVIFYDAFGPRTQPELWDRKATDLCFRILAPGGLLTTYCSQGQFRRNLQSSGFHTEKIPGPPGKREMTRAIKPI